MEYVYAAMLLHKADQKIDDSSLKKVLEAAGVKADDGRIKALVAALDGVDIEEAIKNVAAAPVVASAASADAASSAEAKKEEKKEEEKKDDSAAAAGLGSLFG